MFHCSSSRLPAVTPSTEVALPSCRRCTWCDRDVSWEAGRASVQLVMQTPAFLVVLEEQQNSIFLEKKLILDRKNIYFFTRSWNDKTKQQKTSVGQNVLHSPALEIYLR